MLILAAFIGVMIGISLGALGGGGSILTVPALVYLLGQTPHAATTGSLLIVGITALAGAVAHARAGSVRLGDGVSFGMLGVVGSFVGSHLSARANPDLLLTAFAALMIVAAAAMLRRCQATTRECEGVAAPVGRRPGAAFATISSPGATQLTAQPVTVGHPAETACFTAGPSQCFRRSLRVVAAATIVGLLTGFFGVGGGFVIVPALVLALGFDMSTAVGTSLVVIAINSAVALIARLGSPASPDWPMLAFFTLAAIAGSVLGSRLAIRVDPRRLTQAFAVLLLAVAVYVAARAVPGLM